MKNTQTHCYYLQSGQRIIYPKDVAPYVPPVWRYSAQFLMQFKSLCVNNIFEIDIEMTSPRTSAKHVKNNSKDVVTSFRNAEWDIQQQHSAYTGSIPGLQSISSLDISDPSALFSSIDPVRTSYDADSSLCSGTSTDSHQYSQHETKGAVDIAWQTSTDPLPPHQQNPLPLNIDAIPFVPHFLDDEPMTPVVIPESTPVSTIELREQSIQPSDAISTTPLQNPQISQPQPPISKLGRMAKQFPRGRDPNKSIWADR